MDMLANWKLHKFMWKSYTKINNHQKDRLFDINWNKFKLLIMQIWQQEYNVYYPYKFKTPLIDFYYKKMVTIEYEVNWPYKNAVSITDWITKLNF